MPTDHSQGTEVLFLAPVIASLVTQQQKQKLEEPQTAVSALFGLISVAYWW